MREAFIIGTARGMFTMTLPGPLGGGGRPLAALAIASEQLAAGCAGLANLISVNGLALAAVAATGDLRHLEQICRLLVDGQRKAAPYLLSTAITEPGAGTDVEDVDLLRSARLSCEARPVAGGYRLNGTKVFISNGNIADTHIVIMSTDRAHPVETMAVFRIDRGTPGLSIGRVERKMGQKACPAVELVFEDCFVPERNRIGQGSIAGRGISLVLGASRGPVGAFGAGVALGAYERALEYAHNHKLGAGWLIDQQWVQLRLADMLRNVMIARGAYLEAVLANSLFGLTALLDPGRLAPLARLIPQAVFAAAPTSRVAATKQASRIARRALDGLGSWQVDVASGYGAAAKVSGSELGMANSHLALDIMGADGLRHDHGMEKLFRDAKLLEIYEGTNQLNRIEIYHRCVGRDAA